MSFIDKALERAKALHKKEKAGSTKDAPSASPLPPLMSPVQFVENEIVPPELSYTVTRTVAVNQEVMRRNRLLVPGAEAEGPVAEGYKVLRTHILQRTMEAGHNTLMITGALPGEGKTLTAINLAISISQEINQTVLLVDADLRSPSVHRYFGLPPGEGLVDHLIAGVPIDELLVNPEGIPKLVLLPGGKPATRAPELINSPLMKDLVQDLKHFYPNRYVLFDLPPLLSYADPLAFAPLVDGIILVVEAGRTAREDIERCQGLLKKFNLLGVVLNKVEFLHQGYYYYRKEGSSAKKLRFPLSK